MKALIALISIAALGISSANADTWMSYGYAYDYDYDYLRSDRVSREHRDAGDVDDWIERGNSTVTSSPLPGFEDGIRLSAWASGNEEDYDFALASAIYLFEIPERSEYVEIKLRYRGDAQEADFDDYEEIAGRVWVRNLRKEREHRSYGELEDNDTLYGDTFVLRARRRSETIKIPAADHIRDGSLELHLVVAGGGMLDVEYLDVTTYRRTPDIRVVHRYVRDYDWRPWPNYTYAYFYDGPSFYATDYDYYIAWSYPIYDHHYLTVRRNYYHYLRDYHRRFPGRYVHRPHVDVDVDVHVSGRRSNVQRRVRHLTKWTDTHQQTRQVYVKNGQTVKTRVRGTTPEVRSRVRTTIQAHREKPVLSERAIRDRTARQRVVTQRQRSTTTSNVQSRSNVRSEQNDSLLQRRSRTGISREGEQEQRVRIQSRDANSRISSTTRQQRTESTNSLRATQERRAQLEQRIKQRQSSSTRSSSSTRARTTSPPKRAEVKTRQQPAPSQSSKEDEEEKEKQQQQQQQQRQERTKRRK